jgi:uncharacterized protein with HEPN domain
MPLRDDSLTLRQMLDHAREAAALATSHTRPDMDSDRLLGLATLQLLLILGESASRVSEAFREAHAEIPWAQIIALRNRLIHGYDTVDFDIVWKVIVEDLPPLIELLEALTVSRERQKADP